MNTPSQPSNRQQTTERQVQRIDRKIARLQIASNRVSWIRVLVFITGIASGLGIGTFNALAGWLAVLVTLTIFVAVVSYHRRLENWKETFAIWRRLKLDQLARSELAWDDLPLPAVMTPHTNPSLARDLDLVGIRSLHHLLDTTVSRQGSQLLADWLTESAPDLEQIHTRQRLVRELVPLSRFRERFRLAFRLVMQEKLEGEKLLQWLAVEFPSRQLTWALPAATLFIIVNLILLTLNLWGGQPAYWLIPVALYAVFYLTSQSWLAEALDALVRLDIELDRFRRVLVYLENFSYAGHENLAQLCVPFRQPLDRPSKHLRQIKFVTIAIGLRSNPVLAVALNFIFPWDFFFAWLSDRYRKQMLDAFPQWAQICYTLDALIALGNFADLNPSHVFPEIMPTAQPIFQATNLGHPLIPFRQNVGNAFTIQNLGEVAIITGSNMAGKSTFLKTIGINLRLAYTGAPVHATFFRAMLFELYTCIRISDSVIDGFSYFYAEVKCLRGLLDKLKSNRSRPVLYFIDEIFRGTNNRERLLGSRAYVRALIGANGSGLIATHDLELAQLANENAQVQNYHFEDQVQDGKLSFDYTLRPGPSSTTNALKIMQMEGLPVDSPAPL